MMKHYCLALFVFAATLGTAWAQPGTLDASFANKGIQKFSFKSNKSDEEAAASVQDASGNLYITGSEADPNSQAFVMKMLPTGKLDLSFGNNGKITVKLDSYSTFTPGAIALQADGKIILAGYYNPDGNYGCIVRLNGDGSLDMNFGYQGFYQYGYQMFFSTVMVTSDNKIIAGGGSSGESDPSGDFMIAVLDNTGNPITVKGNENGILDIDFNTQSDYITSAVVKNNVIYFAGVGSDAFGRAEVSYSAFDVTQLDTVQYFGRRQLLDGSQDYLFCTTVQFSPDQGLLFGGYKEYYTNNSLKDFLLVKTNKNGVLDNSFSSTGFQVFNFSSSTDSRATAMFVEATGDIILGGTMSTSSGTYNWQAIRVKVAGAKQDATFNSAGAQAIASNIQALCTVLKAKDGSYYLVGSTSPAGATEDVLVKKIKIGGNDVTGFGSGSQANFWVEDYDAVVKDMVKTAAGKFWVCGNYNDPELGSQAVVALLNSDGSIDATTVKGNADPGVININTLMAPLNFQATVASVIEIHTNGILVAGNFFNQAVDNTDAFIIKLNADGTLQTTFNAPANYNSFSLGNSYPHDIAIQKDNSILLYGYGGSNLTVMRFDTNGATDLSFGGSSTGRYTFLDAQTSAIDMNTVQLKIQPSDQKIVCAGTTFQNDDNGDFLVFRLGTDGTLDPTFGPALNGIFTAAFSVTNNFADYATTLCIKPSGAILVGGYNAISDDNTQTQYGLMQLTSAGVLDQLFGSSVQKGIFTYNAGYQQQMLRDIEYEGVNAITIAGSGGDSKGLFYITALRLTAAGKMDPTFSGQGHTQVTLGYAATGKLYDSKLYLIGSNDKPTNTPVLALMARLTLGTGPVIKNNTLTMPSEIDKNYGDAPFLVTPTTNSYAPITYTMINGNGYATIDATTGLVTLLGSTIYNDGSQVLIQATQNAVLGYEAGTAVCTLYIAQGIPRVVFNDQGGLIGDKFRLAYQTNYESFGERGVELAAGTSTAISVIQSDSVQILDEGNAEVTINFFGTTNFKSISVTARIYGYATPIPPDAANDAVTIISGVNTETDIYVLANDVAYTGQIVTSKVDLDPNTPGTQDTYVSPALGTFFADSSGVVHYFPFQGFVGSGSITYVIQDTHAQYSVPATISVTVKLAGTTPALKATELVTPNNDGLNEAFVIGYIDFDKPNTLKIYDRNGEELVTMNNYRNDWQGNLPNGKQVDNGIYYYLFTEGNDGDSRELKGVVEMKR